MRTSYMYDDPQGLRWSGLAWSNWYPIDKIGRGSGLVPTRQGVYRLRCPDRPELIYIGMTVAGLRSRIGHLSSGTHRTHVAAPLVADHLKAGNIAEISWVTLPGLDRFELSGLEADLITALSARVSREGLVGLGPVQVLALALVCMLAIGAPFVQMALPQEAQSLLTEEYSTLGLGLAIAMLIVQNRKN